MSHIATVAVAMKDRAALVAACQRLGIDPPVCQKYKFFDGTEVEGELVRLKGWNYPVVIQGDGQAVFDNYNGAWGKIEGFNALKQAYAVEAAKSKARQQGFAVTEKRLANGQIQLVCAKG